MADHAQTKEKIMQILKTRGPCLPVHISSNINSSILFTSAFLSELLSEKIIKTSHLRVGSSPIYFIPGQEPQLEKYSQYVKGKEKDALQLLKDNKFLEDEKQAPAIRVALRAIKDFAIPFRKKDKNYWRYFTTSENEFWEEEIKIQIEEKISNHSIEIEKESQDISLKIKEADVNPLNIFDEKKDKEELKLIKKSQKKILRKKPAQKANEKFFDKIKEFLSEKNIEISGIEGFSKDDLTLKIKEHEKEKLLIAYNKKRLTETDIINAHKKAKEQHLRYKILSLGEPLKKTTTLIEALRDLDNIEKIE